MGEFRKVCRVDEVPEKEGKTVSLGDKVLAIFRENGQFYALDDFCPHMGASLSGGHVANGTVTCPWHAWRFRLRDGAWGESTRVRIPCYAVRVVGDEVQVDPTPPPKPAPPAPKPSAPPDEGGSRT